ncbi:protein of unknown function [Azospirillum lipoferum 4B]|uniref:Uncharacterized protein n=1 Tax=Azospirillum lipoferum (strain 4B) TaxID=862719 RepID=G7Z1M6_AZOL4|nr:protein of unknown function [Azospirillum lipoferum 4B]
MGPFCLFASGALCYRPDFAGGPAGVCAPVAAAFAMNAGVAELVDALDLGSSDFGRMGSSPFARTMATPWTAWTTRIRAARTGAAGPDQRDRLSFR